MTNVGLSIQLPLVATTSSRLFYAILRCSYEFSLAELWIPLLRVEDTFIRRAWPPIPLKFPNHIPQRYLAPPRQIMVPRFERYGELDDVWQEPEFLGELDKHMLIQLLVSPSLEGYFLYKWSTTDGASLHADSGFFEVHHAGGGGFEGAQLLFVNIEAKKALTVLTRLDATCDAHSMNSGMRPLTWTSDFDKYALTPRMWYPGDLGSSDLREAFTTLEEGEDLMPSAPIPKGIADWMKEHKIHTDRSVRFETQPWVAEDLLKVGVKSRVGRILIIRTAE